MYPILLEINGYILPAWHVMFLLAAIATGYSFLYFGQRAGFDPRALRLLYLMSYLGGYFGARGFNIVAEEQGLSVMSPSIFFGQLLTPGGMTFYGGFLGALVMGGGFMWLWRDFRVKPYSSAVKAESHKLRLWDLALLCGFLGLAIGRIGCFLNGDDFGKVVRDPHWQFIAVSFPKVVDFLPRYPVQLMSTLFATLLFLVGIKTWLKQSLRPGKIGVLAICTYGAFRFLIEFLRGDPRQFLAGYSISQWVSAALLATIAILAVIKLTASLARSKTPSNGTL